MRSKEQSGFTFRFYALHILAVFTNSVAIPLPECFIYFSMSNFHHSIYNIKIDMSDFMPFFRDLNPLTNLLNSICVF